MSLALPIEKFLTQVAVGECQQATCLPGDCIGHVEDAATLVIDERGRGGVERFPVVRIVWSLLFSTDEVLHRNGRQRPAIPGKRLLTQPSLIPQRHITNLN